MKVVRGRADARWLPSRHHFALFRLYAFLRLAGAKPQPREGLVLVIDRDQTAFEHHGASIWIMLTLMCYIAAGLSAAWPLPLAIAASIPIAAIVIEIPMYVSGLLLRQGAWLNGIATLLFMAGLSAYFARQGSWARFVAYQFFAVLAINAVAAIVVFLLRAPIARLERGVLSES